MMAEGDAEEALATLEIWVGGGILLFALWPFIDGFSQPTERGEHIKTWMAAAVLAIVGSSVLTLGLVTRRWPRIGWIANSAVFTFLLSLIVWALIS